MFEEPQTQREVDFIKALACFNEQHGIIAWMQASYPLYNIRIYESHDKAIKIPVRTLHELSELLREHGII